MLKPWGVRSVVVAVVAIAAAAFSPALRAKISSHWANLSGWTEEARRADPAGFAQYASGKLQHDVEIMEGSRRKLSVEIGDLAGKLRSQEAFHDQARQLSEEFRAKYQQAVADGSFPIQVHSAAYTQAQVKAQVSMILAEISGHESAIARLEKVKKQAETQLEAITVRINGCESQLAALAVQQEMLRAEQLSEEGERLLAQVDQLLDDNSRALADNPVRTVRELMASTNDRTGVQAADATVEAFLAARPTGKAQAAKPTGNAQAAQADTPVVAAPPAPQQALADEPVPEKEPTTKEKSKPVFAQY
jgi:chromosome segregation ATPase